MAKQCLTFTEVIHILGNGTWSELFQLSTFCNKFLSHDDILLSFCHFIRSGYVFTTCFCMLKIWSDFHQKLNQFILNFVHYIHCISIQLTVRDNQNCRTNAFTFLCKFKFGTSVLISWIASVVKAWYDFTF